MLEVGGEGGSLRLTYLGLVAVILQYGGRIHLKQHAPLTGKKLAFDLTWVGTHGMAYHA